MFRVRCRPRCQFVQARPQTRDGICIAPLLGLCQGRFEAITLTDDRSMAGNVCVFSHKSASLHRAHVYTPHPGPQMLALLYQQY